MDVPPKLLLVEGESDRHVVAHLMRRQDLERPFDIRNKRGFDNLRDSILPELNAPGRAVLGILADANASLVSRWDSLAATLTNAGCSPPPTPSPTGSVFDGPLGVRAGVWLMPDNQSSGEIEDFVADMIPQGDPLWPQATAYIDGIPSIDRRFPEAKLSRARVHAWLSAQSEPRLMGAAIRDGDLDINVPVATAFVAWLRALFG